MKPYEIRFTREAVRDFGQLTPKLRRKLKEILTGAIAPEPRSGKRLIGDLAGFYSMRLTYKDRIVYSIDNRKRIVYIHRVKTHYGD